MIINPLLRRSMPNFGGMTQATVPQVLVTGASGRVAQVVKRHLGASFVPATRELFNDPTPAKLRNYQLILNLAATSSGTYDELHGPNVARAQQLALAAQDVGIPFIQASTTAALVPGINPEDTPYAFTKREAEKALGALPNVRIARLDALVEGVSSKIDISDMAGSGLPFFVQLARHDVTLQPISYETAAKVLTKMVEMCLQNPEAVPSEVNIAGEAVSLNDFVRMINPDGIEVTLELEDVERLAAVVQNGTLSPEFMHLARLASSDPMVHENQAMLSLLQDPISSPQELADGLRTQMSVMKTIRTGTEVLLGKKTDKSQLFRAVLQLAKQAKVRNPLAQPSVV